MLGGGMHHASQILDEIQAKHKEVIEMMKGMGGDKDGNNNIQTSEIFGEDSEKINPRLELCCTATTVRCSCFRKATRFQT